MNRICAKSWGTTASGWNFCCLERGHPGNCANSALGPKPASALFFEDQPEAQAEIEAQRVRQAKEDAKKGR